MIRCCSYCHTLVFRCEQARHAWSSGLVPLTREGKKWKIEDA
jgi:hypothetical protein